MSVRPPHPLTHTAGPIRILVGCPAGGTALGDFLEFNTAGKLRVIATIDTQRAPQPMVQRVNAAVARVLAQPGVRERMVKLVFEPVTGTPEALSNRVAVDTRYWEPIIRSSGWVLQ